MFSKIILASKTAFVVLFATLAVFYKTDSDLFLRFSSFKLEHSFEGKVIWITGASSGIGAFLTHDLVKAGAKVIISARRKELLDEIAGECATFGVKPYVYPFDVKNYDDQLAVYNEILNLYGRVDILVLNPGISQRALALDTPLEDTQELFNLNFFPFISLTKIVLPDMIKNGGGQIVVMSSLSGRIGTPIATSYSATKYALHGYFDGLRAELLPSNNITISLVCPGPVESGLVKKTQTKPMKEGTKMPTARCSYLIAKGMYLKLDEFWISHNPYLIGAYLNTYFPWISRQLWKYVLGPARVKILNEGGSLYDTKSVFGLGSNK